MCQNPKIVYSKILPCGKCEECLKRKRIIEYNRLKYAFKRYGRAFHLTLTYDNEHVACAKFEDVRRFIEKVRRQKHFNCEYYCVKEYGEKHGRIHFHLILFVHTGISNKEIIESIDLWNKGFVKIRVCNRPSGFRYLTDYLFKQYGGVDSTKRNFTCSRDLGYREFFNEYEPYCVSSTYTGSWTYLPRSWKIKYIKFMQETQADYWYYSGVIHRLFEKGGLNKVIPVSVVIDKSYTYSTGVCESDLIRVSREVMKRLKDYYNEGKLDFCKACLMIKYIIPYFGHNMPGWLLEHVNRVLNEPRIDIDVDLVFQYIDFNVPCSEFFDCDVDIVKCVFQDWEIEKYGNSMIDGFNILI